MRLTHVVLVRPRRGAAERAEAVAERLAALAVTLGAGEAYAGPNVSDEPFGGGHTVGIALTFSGTDARDRYLNDARHRDLARELSTTAESVLVADVPVAKAAVSDDGHEGAQRT